MTAFLSWILSFWVGCCSVAAVLDGDLHRRFAVARLGSPTAMLHLAMWPSTGG